MNLETVGSGPIPVVALSLTVALLLPGGRSAHWNSTRNTLGGSSSAKWGFTA